MKPYYQDDHVTLYHGDCLEHPEWWTGADVLVTDPPYGVSWSGGARNRKDYDATIASDHSLDARDEMLSLWSPDLPAIVFGVWQQPHPEGTKARLVWVKNIIGPGDLTIPWGPADEEIYILGKWPPLIPGGSARDGGTPARALGHFTIPVVPKGFGHQRFHPTQKPTALMEHLIDRCPPGTVADPFAGSGSTLVAAKRLGRRAVGVELEERYCEIAANRLSQGVLPLWEGGAA